MENFKNEILKLMVEYGDETVINAMEKAIETLKKDNNKDSSTL